MEQNRTLMGNDRTNAHVLDINGKVHSVFEENAERIFIIEAWTGRHYTYREFYAASLRIARILQINGIRYKDRTAILLTNSTEYAALYFACLLIGAVAVPVNPKFHKNEIDFIISHSAAKLLIYSSTTKEIVNETHSLSSMPRIDLSHENLQEHKNSRIDHTIKGEDLFLITLTSGTTSMPKGVAHSVRGIIGNAAAFNGSAGINRDNRFLHVMSMSYMAGILNTLFCPFVAGAGIVLGEMFDARTVSRFWKPVVQYSANTFWLSPTMLAALVQADRDHLAKEYCHRNVRNVFAGTAPLPLKVRKDFENKYGIPVYESYGLSEILLVTTNSAFSPVMDGSVGKLLPDVRMRITDDMEREVLNCMSGEIWVRTPYAMTGYLNYETLEPDTLSPDTWFPTGDMGIIDSNGYVYITGRKKDLIIKGGENISPRAIEDVLLEHESVEQVAVIGLPHYFYGEEVAAVIKLRPGYNFEMILPDLGRLCREKLNNSCLPARFFNIGEMPLSSTGKIQKTRLREMLAEGL